MKFRYYLSGWGWAFLDIEFDGFKPTTYYADAFCGGLSDLLLQIIAVLNINNEFRMHHFDCEDETNHINWRIDQEGSTVEFDFTVNENKDKALLKIIQHNFILEYECVYNGEINFIKFVKEIVRSCDDILNKYGILGYCANSMRDDDFPITFYLLLKNYLYKKIEKMEMVYEKLPCDEDEDGKESDLFKTDINKELDLIKIRGNFT
jgi:hypothetical protein